MAHLTITVPKEHADDVRRELLRAHARCAAQLRESLERYLYTHERLDDVDGALVELSDLHEALIQLGWTRDEDAGDVRVTAHPELLSDALEAAGLAGGER